MSDYVDAVLDRFIEQYQGKSVDFSGIYGPQSPDLISTYMAALTGIERDFPYAYAFDLWPDIRGFMEYSGFERVIADYQPGDIAVFGPGAGISEAGTLAILTGFKGHQLEGFTQTPGPAEIRRLSIWSLLGAWRLTAGAECVKAFDDYAQDLISGRPGMGKGRHVKLEAFGGVATPYVPKDGEQRVELSPGRRLIADWPDGYRISSVDGMPVIWPKTRGDVAVFEGDPQNPYGHTEIVQPKPSVWRQLVDSLKWLFSGRI